MTEGCVGDSLLVARLGELLDRAPDVDSLARTLFAGLTQPGGLCCVERVALGLVQDGGRRLLLLDSDGDVGEPGRPAVWTTVDAGDSCQIRRAAQQREPVLGGQLELGEKYPGLVREPRRRGPLSLAVVPLGPWGLPAVGPAGGTAEPPLGVLLLSYTEEQTFGSEVRRDLSHLALVADRALRALLPRPGGAGGEAVTAEPSGVDAVATTLPDDERAPAMARRFLRAQLRAWGVPDDDTATAELCLTELVTNAVIHGGGSTHVSVALVGEELEVRVRDRGPSIGELLPMPSTAGEDALAVHGRGLVLVEALTRAWGSERRRDGTNAWFRLGLGETG